MLFFGVLRVCACKCGTRVAGHAREATRSLQVVCTRLGPTLGVFFGPKMSLWCFYGLTFSMILDYHVHGDICVKCYRQVKMDSSVESDPRNVFSGGVLPLGRQGIALAIWRKTTKEGF